MNDKFQFFDFYSRFSVNVPTFINYELKKNILLKNLLFSLYLIAIEHFEIRNILEINFKHSCKVDFDFSKIHSDHLHSTPHAFLKFCHHKRYFLTNITHMYEIIISIFQDLDN